MDNGSIPFRSHTALLLSAALPHLQPTYRHPIEVALKFLEFSETMKLYREFHGSEPLFPFPDSKDKKNTGLFGLIDTFVLDLEGLLGSLSQVCTGDEKELIGMFLNLIRAKNFYETYGDLMKSMMSAEGGTSPFPFPFGGTSAEETESVKEHSSEHSSAPFPSELSSMLTNDQKETLDLLKSLFANE